MKAFELCRELSSVCGAAWRGLLHAVRSQRNLRIHLLCAGAVLAAGVALDFSRPEMGILLLTVAAVLVSELFNTAVELVLDLLEARHHPVVRMAKDVAAGGVLVAVFGSVVVGLLLFGPRLRAALGRF